MHAPGCLHGVHGPRDRCPPCPGGRARRVRPARRGRYRAPRPAGGHCPVHRVHCAHCGRHVHCGHHAHCGRCAHHVPRGSRGGYPRRPRCVRRCVRCGRPAPNGGRCGHPFPRGRRAHCGRYGHCVRCDPNVRRGRHVRRALHVHRARCDGRVLHVRCARSGHFRCRPAGGYGPGAWQATAGPRAGCRGWRRPSRTGRGYGRSGHRVQGQPVPGWPLDAGWAPVRAAARG